MHALGKILNHHGLHRVQPVSADHLAFMLKSGYNAKQSKLMVCAKVPTSQAMSVKRFHKEAIEQVLHDVNPYTYLISIDVTPFEVGHKLEKITDLADLATGNDVTLQHNAGEVLAINFWASWCKPSAKHIQDIVSASKLFEGKNVRFVNLSVDLLSEKAQEFMASYESTPQITNLHLGESSADLAFGASKMPRIVLVNKDGVICYLGHPEKVNLKETLETLLKGEELTLEK